jgi:hypothetical protein
VNDPQDYEPLLTSGENFLERPCSVQKDVVPCVGAVVIVVACFAARLSVNKLPTALTCDPPAKEDGALRTAVGSLVWVVGIQIFGRL